MKLPDTGLSYHGNYLVISLQQAASAQVAKQSTKNDKFEPRTTSFPS